MAKILTVCCNFINNTRPSITLNITNNFIPRVGDTLDIDGTEYDVKNVLINTETNHNITLSYIKYIILYLKEN